MRVTRCPLDGLLLLEPRIYRDDRGFFMESWHQDRYADVGVAKLFVQDNLSHSHAGTLRGMHFQNPFAQDKLVQVLMGEVFDVAVDLRRSSPTFGRWHAEVLSSENQRQFYIPAGFAHGFLVTSSAALFHYKCSGPYSPDSEATLLWNDPDVGIRWPGGVPRLSDRDARGLRLKDMPPERLFP